MSAGAENGLKKRKTSTARQDSPTSSTNVPDSAIPPVQLKTIEEQLLRLTTMVDALRQNGSTDSSMRELFTPGNSSSDHDSDEAASRVSLSLDMFQAKIQGPPRDVNELSRPLSSLKLGSSDSRESRQDPFWIHISEELDQLNHMMRRRNNTYASSTSIQNQACDTPHPLVSSPKDASAPDKDDFWEPSSFHRAAGVGGLHAYNLDADCPTCQTMPFAKVTLLQSLPLRCSHAAARQHLFDGFPSRTQSNVLFRCWLSNIYPVLPILIPSDILTKHEALWEKVETVGYAETEHLDLEFFTLMYAIWYSGALSLSAKGLRHWFPGTSRAALASRFHDHVVFALHLGSFTRDATLQKLATLLLIQSVPVAEEDPLQASLYMQLNVRMALAMGLHREPTLFGLSVAEEGMRRRLWWQLIQLDTSLVVASGYPSLISESFCDTRINCEDPDAFVEDNDGGAPNTEPGKLPKMSQKYSWGEPNPTDEGGHLTSYRTMSLVARAKSIMACALRTVVSLHLGTKMLTNRDMHEMKRVIAEASDQLDTIIKMIPAKGLPELGFVPDTASRAVTNDCDDVMGGPVTPNELAYYKTYISDADLVSPLARYHRQKLAAYNKWARISLSMMKDRLHVVSYAPFLKNAKSKLWTAGRQCALHHCHAFMRKFLSLAEDRELENLRWCWPASYGPLHAALIVLVDLYERPQSAEAPRSREMVDRMFVLASPGAGIVGGADGVSVQRPLREGGVEAWDMLRGLRSAAWQKAGLDPTVLWTEADQLAVGVATPLTHEQKIAQSLREDTIYDDSNDGKSGVEAAGSSQNGVMYMMGLTQAEATGSTVPAPCGQQHNGLVSASNGHHQLEDSAPVANGQQLENDALPCSRTQRNQFLTDIENRRSAGRPLARRDGQPAMPFPLSGHMEKCTRHVVDRDLPTELLHNGSTSLHPTGASLHTCPSQLSKEALAAYENVHIQSSVNGDGGVYDQALPSRGEDTQNGVHGQVHTNGVGSNGLATNGAGTNGIATNGTNTNGVYPNSHDSQPTNIHHGNGAIADTGAHANGVTAPSQGLDFDWERWDAVFGQYSGFTEMMEDVTWEDYAE